MIELLPTISGVGMLAGIFAGPWAARLGRTGVLVGAAGGLDAALAALVLLGGGQ